MKKQTILSLMLILSLGMISSSEKSNFKLIAHRGGVVEGKYPENSKASIEEAIRRGYWMLEVDIRETKDGIAVAQHDADFERFFGHPGKASEMTWDEIKKLRSSPGNERPLLFDEFAALCKGKIFLMLDTKEPHTPEFLVQIEATLKKYDLLSSAYVIGTHESGEYLKGKAKVGKDPDYIKEELEKGKNVKDLYFLFMHGKGLDEATVQWAQEQGITIVPSINTFHYKSENAMDEAKADIERLKKMGITEFQIDSEYDRWF